MTHSTVHTKIKPYACENCNLTFSCIGNLIKHRKVRPNSCGLPIFTNKKICKRAGVKCEKGKNPKIVVDSSHISLERQEAGTEVITHENDDFTITEIVQELNTNQQHNEPQISAYSDHQYIVIAENNQPIQDVQIIEDYTKKEMDVFDFIGIEIRNIEQEERERKAQLERDEPSSSMEFEEIIDEYDQDIIEDDDPSYEAIEENIEEFETENFIVVENEFENEHLHDEDTDIGQYFEITDENFKCKLCPKIYQKKNISIKHLKKEHQIVITTFNYDNANRYRRPQKNQTWKCQYCPKKYTSIKMAQRHEQVHGDNGQLIFKCSCCAIYFQTLEEVNEHQQTEHGDRLVCNVDKCLKKFDHPEKLISHKKYAHSENRSPHKKYTFVCIVCGMYLIEVINLAN